MSYLTFQNTVFGFAWQPHCVVNNTARLPYEKQGHKAAATNFRHVHFLCDLFAFSERRTTAARHTRLPQDCCKTRKVFSLAESGLDLDLRYIENVLIDYDRQHLQTSESDGCHLVTFEQLAKFKMASKRVAIYKELAIIGPYYTKAEVFWSGRLLRP